MAKLTTERHTYIDNQYAESSRFSGETVALSAGRDMTLEGAEVTSSQDLTLKAGRDINITAATETQHEVHIKQEKKSGLMSSGGIGFTVGAMKENLEQTDSGKSHLGSIVGSTEGHVSIIAGKDITIKGSDVIAGRDIAMQGENIHVESLTDETRYREEYRMEKSGLTVALTGTAAQVYEAAEAVKRAKESGSDKVLALQSIKAGLTVVQAIQEMELANKEGGKQASIGVSIMGGTQVTEREVNQSQNTVLGSGISAGGNITMTATGDKAGSGGDITIKGSEVKAGNDITLDANRDINLIASVNTQHSDREETSYGTSVGIGLTIGGDESGFRVKGSANFSKERENADGSAWSEAVVDAGNNLIINSGRDVNLIGGQMKGDTVVADIGGDLTIKSLQDTDNYDYEKLSASVDGSYGTGASLNMSLSHTEMESNWASVVDQAGIYAGKGGYAIRVEGNTDLKGAVIASEATDALKNVLDTGTISFTDIENKADFNVSHVSVSAGTSGVSANGYHNSDKDHSTTHSAVEQGVIIVRDQENQQQDINDLSRDTENANNVLGQLFDKEKALENIEVAGLVNDIRQQATTVMSNLDKLEAQREVEKSGYPDKATVDAARAAHEEKQKADPTYKVPSDDEIKNELFYNAVQTTYKQKQEENNRGMGSDTNKAIDAVTSIVTGALTGDMTGGLAGAAAPYLAEKIKEATTTIGPDGERVVNTEVNAIAHALLGAVVAELKGGSALGGAAGAVTGELAVGVIMEQFFPGKKINDLSEADKEYVLKLANLAAGMAGAAVSGGSTAGIGSAIEASDNAVQNNALAPAIKGAEKGVELCLKSPVCQGAVVSVAISMGLPEEETRDVLNNVSEFLAPQGLTLEDLANMSPAEREALFSGPLINPDSKVINFFKELFSSEDKLPTNTGGNQIADSLPANTGGNQLAPDLPTDTGGNQIVEGGVTDTGGNQITESDKNSGVLPGSEIETGNWQDNILTSQKPAVDPNVSIATGITVGDFEKSLVGLPPGERIAIVKGTSQEVAAANGLVKDSVLTKKNGRDVYRGPDGNLYALDTQHGRFEMTTSKGQHLGEVDFSFQKIPNSIDKSGGHDLKVK